MPSYRSITAVSELDKRPNREMIARKMGGETALKRSILSKDGLNDHEKFKLSKGKGDEKFTRWKKSILRSGFKRWILRVGKNRNI